MNTKPKYDFSMIFRKDRAAGKTKLGGPMLFLCIAAVLVVAVVLGSQWMAHTPIIRGADGKPLPGSIAVVEKVKLGGVTTSG